MRRRFHFRLYGYGYYGYFCKLCRRGDLRFATYRGLRRHQFAEPDACVAKHLQAEIIHEEDVPFDGARASVPASPLASDQLAEHRDTDGRLRVGGKLTGYRHWAIGRMNGQFRLFPVFVHHETPQPYARGVATAYCANEGWDEPHRSPFGECSCGLYALWDLKTAAHHRSLVQHATILGQVEAWGKSLPGTSGFRSEKAMIAALYTPSCVVPGCHGQSSSFVTRPEWIDWMTPGGRTYPRINDRRHTTYRDTADFTSSRPRADYLGWFCDAHSKGDLLPPSYSGCQCNYPRASDGRPCTRPSTFTLAGFPYSWCHEHAPLVFDTAEVMEGLHNFYDLLTPGTLSVEDYLSSDGPGSRAS